MPAFPFPTDLNAFIAWLSGPAAVGVITSVLLERIGAYQALPPRYKAIVAFVLSLALPVISVFIQAHVTPDQLVHGQVIVDLLLQGLVLWTTGQLAHGIDPQRLWPVVDVALQFLNSTQSQPGANFQPAAVDWSKLVKRIADIEAAVAGQPEPKA